MIVQFTLGGLFSIHLLHTPQAAVATSSDLSHLGYSAEGEEGIRTMAAKTKQTAALSKEDIDKWDDHLEKLIGKIVMSSMLCIIVCMHNILHCH